MQNYILFHYCNPFPTEKVPPKKKKKRCQWGVTKFKESDLFGFWEVTRLRSLKGVVVTSEQMEEQINLIYGLWHVWLVTISSGQQYILFLKLCLVGVFYTEHWWDYELI